MIIEENLLKTYRNYSSRARSLASSAPTWKARQEESAVVKQKFHRVLVDELNTDLSEVENEGMVLTEAERKGVNTQLDR